MDSSGSQESFIKPHLRALQEFLRTVLTPRDKAFVISFANSIRLVSDYSGDARYHVTALEQFGKAHDVSSYPIVGPRERRILGTAFYDAIYYGATQIMQNAERGHHALIVFSDGEDNSSAHHMLDAIEAAQSNNVLLFTIRYTEAKQGMLNARNKYGIGVMQRIALETGGLDFDGQGAGLLDGFRQIGDQLRSSYELAYHTSNPPGGKTFHKILIRPRQPDLNVRSKTGYYGL
jgi:Ca-activated chloride channel family protein